MPLYGTNTIPGDLYDVVAGESTQVGLAFTRSVTLIGGMDLDGDSSDDSLSAGTASTGEVKDVNNLKDAEDFFGRDSELYRGCKAALSANVTDLDAIAVPETDHTQSFTGSSSGTLDNTPIMNPVFHPDHGTDRSASDGGLTVTQDPGGSDTDIDVNIVYDAAHGGSVSSPSEADTVNLDAYTGDWEADESGDYDFEYTVGDYSKSAVLTAAADTEHRSIAVGQETETIIGDLEDEIGESGNADEFVFQNGYSAVQPWADSASPDTSGYSDGLDDLRISINSTPVAYFDSDETNAFRMQFLVAAYQSSIPVGVSSTFDTLPNDELTEIRTEMTTSEASDMIDSQVMPILKSGSDIEIIKDLTTSTTAKFERIYAIEIVDEVTENSHQLAKEYLGTQNTEGNRQQLRRDHKNLLEGFKESSPPLLDDFSISVSEDSTNANQVDVTLGVDVVDVIDTIDATVRVGDVTQVEVS